MGLTLSGPWALVLASITMPLLLMLGPLIFTLPVYILGKVYKVFPVYKLILVIFAAVMIWEFITRLYVGPLVLPIGLIPIPITFHESQSFNIQYWPTNTGVDLLGLVSGGYDLGVPFLPWIYSLLDYTLIPLFFFWATGYYLHLVGRLRFYFWLLLTLPLIPIPSWVALLSLSHR